VTYIDTHCHLNHDLFHQDLEAVLQRANESDVNHFLVPGWDVASSKAAISLAETHAQILAAVGIHPIEWPAANSEALEEIQKLAQHPRVVAIGEVGLDFHHDPEHSKEKAELLNKMLSIAFSVDKPILIHSRNSMNALIELLSQQNKQLRGIIHAFEGDLSQAKELIHMGFMLGVGGPLTYKNSETKQQVFREISDQSIVLETDAPYLPPIPYRGQRNEPSFLPLVAERLAILRNQNKMQLFEQIYQNSYKMFL
jgi:TatD DNase family protein